MMQRLGLLIAQKLFFESYTVYMKAGLFIAGRIVFNRQPSFSRFIIRLATAATALSVAAIVITMAMINGFQHTVSQKVYSFWGHMRVHELSPFRSSVSEEYPITISKELEAQISSTPGVKHYHAYGTRSVVLRTNTQFEGVLLKGVSQQFSKSGFDQQFLRQGRMIHFGDSNYSTEIMISDLLAKQLELKVGSTLQVFFLKQGEEIRTRTATIVGLFHTGIDEYDRQFAIADLRFLQRIAQWQPNEAAGYEIWLANTRNIDQQARQLYEQLPQGLAATPVAKLYPNIFDWLSIQDQTRRVVIGVMLAVAVINLLTCLLILVMERTRMVAVLSALGMAQKEIRQIFWYYAAWIAGIGIMSGLVLSLGLLGLQQLTGIIKLDESTYYVRTMPVKIIWWEVLAVVVGAFFVCLLALRLPLVYTRKISVVKALRFS